MALWGKLMGEFVDVIQWTDDSRDTMVYRFERYGNEIKHGAKLTVREGQMAVFVNEGQIADVFGPGMYELLTANLPILSTLQGWPHGFQSPFKAEVYFFSTRRFTDLKWGTKNPVMMRDPEFGPVRLRAFGTYVIRIADPALFLKEIVGTDGRFTTEDITNQIRNQITARFGVVVGSAGIPVLDLAANYDQLGQFLTNKIAPELAGFGLELVQMLVENISLPPEVEKALDRRTSMGVVGDLGKYAQFQAAEAMRAAAENPGGTAGAGVGMGIGFAMANQMGQMFQPGGVAPSAGQAPQPQPAAAPPPLPQAAQQVWHVAADGKAAGPFTLEELRQRIPGGGLTRTSLVWSEGMKEWAKAGEVEALQPLFASVPPPVPPVA
ncbi:MAG TPA: SPFH domain-containing protein [Geminicoccaceae bacterium]|nr:SPFH domain-containing protein [Geminicoccaceae bacterium]